METLEIATCAGRGVLCYKLPNQQRSARSTQAQSKMSHVKHWSNGICGCFNDCATCVVTYLCPCYTFGKTAQKVGSNPWLCGLSQCIPILNCYALVTVRRRIRDKMMIQGTMTNDIAVSVCCPYCGIIQEAQEVKATKASHMVRE
ncbi:hypothetical protein EMCRGX_G006391 [Ephydatia muelleri]